MGLQIPQELKPLDKIPDEIICHRTNACPADASEGLAWKLSSILPQRLRTGFLFQTVTAKIPWNFRSRGVAELVCSGSLAALATFVLPQTSIG